MVFTFFKIKDFDERKWNPGRKVILLLVSLWQGLLPWKYKITIFSYLNGVTASERPASVPAELRVIQLALFGLGRAGSIHLANIIANPRVELAYVVESDKSRWGWCREKWNLGKGTKFLWPQVNQKPLQSIAVDCKGRNGTLGREQSFCCQKWVKSLYSQLLLIVQGEMEPGEGT